MGKKTQDVHVYFPYRVWQALKKMADRNRRSVSAEVVIALEEKLDREKRDGKTQHSDTE